MFTSREGFGDTLLAVAAGEVQGARVVTVLAENIGNDLLPSTVRAVTNVAGAALYQTSVPASMTIVSTAATDIYPAGSGARTVEVEMLDQNYRIVRHTIQMNGLTPVPIPGGAVYLRCNRIEVLTAGGLAPDGRLLVAAGATEVTAADIDTGISKSGLYTVPTGYAALILGSHVSQRITHDSYASWYVFERTALGNAPNRKHRLQTVTFPPITAGGPPSGVSLGWDMIPHAPLKVQGPADIWLAGNPDTLLIAAGRVHARIDLLEFRTT